MTTPPEPASPHGVVVELAAAAAAAAIASDPTLLPARLTDDEVATLLAAVDAFGTAAANVLNHLVHHPLPGAHAERAARSIGMARDSVRWMVNDAHHAAVSLGLDGKAL
ncbi:hypothetical protein [Actinosynnema sp. NPDC023587]|uniref:hypothetical protein n=1 Tax=Actinosynnema sp. NPDC023587 TaxID=3154695 RepID=UPI0033D38F7F